MTTLFIKNSYRHNWSGHKNNCTINNVFVYKSILIVIGCLLLEDVQISPTSRTIISDESHDK